MKKVMFFTLQMYICSSGNLRSCTSLRIVEIWFSIRNNTIFTDDLKVYFQINKYAKMCKCDCFLNKFSKKVKSGVIFLNKNNRKTSTLFNYEVTASV